MWLAPFLYERRDEGVYKTINNEVIFNFDKPQIISAIKFWNYSKTPDRGVRELEIFADENVIYRVSDMMINIENLGIYKKVSID
jgi:hypothetical protein